MGLSQDEFEQFTFRETGQREKLCPAEFELKAQEVVINGEKQWRDVEWIKIFIDARSEDFRPATDEDREKYFRQYKRFKATGQDSPDGTPLKVWPAITPGQIKELEYRGVRTIEQLADANDSLINNFLGGVTLKARARAWLEQKAGVGHEKLAAENAALKEKMEALQAQVSDLVRVQTEARLRPTAEEKKPKRAADE